MKKKQTVAEMMVWVYMTLPQGSSHLLESILVWTINLDHIEETDSLNELTNQPRTYT
jgi:hypothetical protein